MARRLPFTRTSTVEPLIILIYDPVIGNIPVSREGDHRVLLVFHRVHAVAQESPHAIRQKRVTAIYILLRIRIRPEAIHTWGKRRFVEIPIKLPALIEGMRGFTRRAKHHPRVKLAAQLACSGAVHGFSDDGVRIIKLDGSFEAFISFDEFLAQLYGKPKNIIRLDRFLFGTRESVF